MDTRNLGYLGLGALVAIVFVTLVGVPPAVWITAALIAVVVGVAYAVYRARAAGTDIAARMAALNTESVAADPPAQTAPTTVPASPATVPASPATVPASPVKVELVRPADYATGKPDVWLHRFGGRRVHRFEHADGWVVEQVSTKDPDNPKKRVIGEPLTFELEWQAIEAADALAQGVRPADQAPTPRPRPTFAAGMSV